MSWPVNEIRIQCHKRADGCWRVRISGLVNGDYRAHEVEADDGRLADGIARALGVFVTVHRDKEAL